MRRHHGETETEKGLRLMAEDTDRLEENLVALQVSVRELQEEKDRMTLAAKQFYTNLPT